MSSQLIIVNEKDEFIGFQERSTVTNEIHRVSGLWITNDQGEVLLAKRSLLKDSNPGKWGPAVAGTVEQGETYYSNILKEADEELGLKNIQPKEGPKWRVFTKHNYFCQWYFLSFNEPVSHLILQKEEVDEVKWFSKESLKELLQKEPKMFVRSASRWVELF